MSSLHFPADVLCLVLEIGRTAAVVQIVMSKDGKIYGALRFRVPRGLLTTTNSGERLPEEWDCRGILIFDSTSSMYNMYVL